MLDKNICENFIEVFPLPMVIIKGNEVLFTNTMFFREFEKDIVTSKIGHKNLLEVLFNVKLAAVRTILKAHNNFSKLLPGGARSKGKMLLNIFYVDKSKNILAAIITPEDYYLNYFTESVNKIKEEFITVASHQLRTPLSIIKWSLEMILLDNNNLSEDQKKMLLQASESNRRMIDLVNNLLTVSRLESQRSEASRGKESISSIVKTVVKENAYWVQASNQRIKVDDKLGKDNTVKVDRDWLRQIIQNLLSNAIKYSNGGTINISLKKTNNKELTKLIGKSEAGAIKSLPMVLFSINDSGVGISREDQRRIFEKFFRSKNIMTLQTEGSGLGLYITKLIIESAGGRIWFRSKKGRGSTFYFVLPLASNKKS